MVKPRIPAEVTTYFYSVGSINDASQGSLDRTLVREKDMDYARLITNPNGGDSSFSSYRSLSTRRFCKGIL